MVGIRRDWEKGKLIFTPPLPPQIKKKRVLELKLKSRKPTEMAHAFNPRIWDAEAGRALWDQGQPAWGYIERPSFKDKNKTNKSLAKFMSDWFLEEYTSLLGSYSLSLKANPENRLSGCLSAALSKANARERLPLACSSDNSVSHCKTCLK